MRKKKEQRREGQLECYTLPDDCRKNAKEKRTATGWQPVVPQSDRLAACPTPMTDRLQSGAFLHDLMLFTKQKVTDKQNQEREFYEQETKVQSSA